MSLKVVMLLVASSNDSLLKLRQSTDWLFNFQAISCKLLIEIIEEACSDLVTEYTGDPRNSNLTERSLRHQGIIVKEAMTNTAQGKVNSL